MRRRRSTGDVTNGTGGRQLGSRVCVASIQAAAELDLDTSSYVKVTLFREKK